MTVSVQPLKTWPEYFEAVKSGKKTFEIRKNDRNFKVNDLLILQEYNPDTESYTGNEVRAEVTYILDAAPFVPAGYVAMSIKLIDQDWSGRHD